MTTTDYTRQTRSDYAERLDALGVEYPAKATKRDLYELLMRTLREQIERVTSHESPAVCESCGQPATVKLQDGSTWCQACDASARALGYDNAPPLRLADAADARREVAERMRPKSEPAEESIPVHTLASLPLPDGCTGRWIADGEVARVEHGPDAMREECPAHSGVDWDATSPDAKYDGGHALVAAPISQEVVPVNDIPTVGRWEQMKAMAVELAASRLLRPTLQGRWEDVLLILLTGHDLGISSTMALSKIHVIEGVPSAGAELQLALVRRAGHRVTGDVDPDLRWASISGTRADTGETMNVVYKLDEAVAAGRCTITAEGKVRSRSASGKVKPWEASTSDMLWARAVTRLCRRHFADVIGGLSYTPEELGVIDVEGEEVAPVVDHTPLREDCTALDNEHDDDGLCCKVRIAERVRALPDEARAKLRAAWAEETKRGNMPTLKGMDRGAVARAGALIEAAEREAQPAQAEVVDRPPDPAEEQHEEADVVEPEGAS